MANTIIHKRFNGLQENYSKDGEIKMVSQSFRSFLNDLINDYAKLKNDGFHLYMNDIPREERIIFLSHVVEWEEYEDALTNDYRLDAVLSEYRSLMQEILERRMQIRYHQLQQEAGLKQYHHKDNGESYYA